MHLSCCLAADASLSLSNGSSIIFASQYSHNQLFVCIPTIVHVLQEMVLLRLRAEVILAVARDRLHIFICI